MQSLNKITLLFAMVIMPSITNAFPLFNKREIVTRMHTASTTNTVTDVYSTTTKVIVAPTVYFIVDGDSTSTSTAIPTNVDPTALPTTTIVLNRKDLANVPDLLPTSPSISTLSPTSVAAAAAPVATQNAIVSTTSTTSTTPDAPATTTTDVVSQVHDVKTTSTLQPATTATNTRKILSALNDNVFEASEASSHNHEVADTDGVQVIISTTIKQDTTKTTSTSTPAAAAQTTENQQVIDTTTTANAVSTPSTDSSSSPSSSNDNHDSSSSSSSSSTSSDVLTVTPYALAYSPYNSDGSCKGADDVYSDLQIIKNKGISKIRVYGTDCNSFETIQPACSQLGITINQGLWIGDAGVDSLDSSLELLIQYGQSNGWDIFEYITIGNEAVNSGYCSVSDLVNKISSVKSQLKAAGYSGQVTTSEPPVTFENYPELCTNSEIDFVGINPHSYFNGNCDAAGSGEFVKGQVELVQNICGTSNVIITETGYPSQGATNGANIPSAENQLVAVQGILDSNSQVTILTYTNDFWKNPGPYGIEQYFGISQILP